MVINTYVGKDISFINYWLHKFKMFKNRVEVVAKTKHLMILRDHLKYVNRTTEDNKLVIVVKEPNNGACLNAGMHIIILRKTNLTNSEHIDICTSNSKKMLHCKAASILMITSTVGIIKTKGRQFLLDYQDYFRR